MKSIDQTNFNGKKVLIRVDYNVPLNEQFEVTDTTRIERTKETISNITEEGGIAILMSHLGRPKGEVNDKYSLKHIVKTASAILGKEVHFLGDERDDGITAGSGRRLGRGFRMAEACPRRARVPRRGKKRRFFRSRDKGC